MLYIVFLLFARTKLIQTFFHFATFFRNRNPIFCIPIVQAMKLFCIFAAIFKFL